MKLDDISTRKTVILSMLISFGMILFVMESFLPVPPWFRPGFGNISTILALIFFRFGDAFKVTLLRIFLGALVLGRIFTPVFIFALGGGIASFFAMWIFWKYFNRIFSPVGISVIGAIFHNMVQLLIAYLLFVKSRELLIFLPLFLIVGLITGTITGLISSILYRNEKMNKLLIIKNI